MDGRATSDRDLLARVAARDACAFEVLFDRHRATVLRHVARMLHDSAAAEDVAQEVFLRVWTRAEQWTGQGALQSWLLRIGTNLALNHLRTVRRRREQALPPSLGQEEARTPGWMADNASPAPDAQLEQAELRDRFGRMVEGLPEEKREVFRLVHEAQMAVREAAAALGIPEGTARSRLHYARAHLAREWELAAQEWRELG